jgi:hypothetical protein
MSEALQFWGQLGLYTFWVVVIGGAVLYARSKL